ncbi:hypothetical protein KC19_VG107100 [Ceratodon purpureus]|uniref:Uncharacterized protein n=1 Tax=Ceratodon purpureus TaxID=3225 RepID=A0A8T0HP66_CERPU|nr:hypothetical protein KC19_VG107100 [Ceratodon purpureus]
MHHQFLLLLQALRFLAANSSATESSPSSQTPSTKSSTPAAETTLSSNASDRVPQHK